MKTSTSPARPATIISPRVRGGMSSTSRASRASWRSLSGFATPAEATSRGDLPAPRARGLRRGLEAGPEVGHRVLRALLVLEREGPVGRESDLRQRPEDRLRVHHPLAEDAPLRIAARRGEVLQVDAIEAPLQRADRGDGILSRADVVPEVGAGPDPGVEVADLPQEVLDPRPAVAGAVVVSGDPDAGLRDELLEAPVGLGTEVGGEDRDARRPREAEEPLVALVVGAEPVHAVGRDREVELPEALAHRPERPRVLRRLEVAVEELDPVEAELADLLDRLLD